MKVYHNIPPIFDRCSQTLILGSMPSVKSRQAAFYYANPQNRFWRVLEGVFGEPVPVDPEGRAGYLLARGLALWDVAASCEIDGSDDASIRSVKPNDICSLLRNSEITHIYANGRTAEKLYLRLVRPLTGIDIAVLPSTSPANASCSLEKLVGEWSVIAGR